MKTILRTEDVSKHFGGIKALQGVSMEAESDKITGLIGPNGSGKTTLFNIITGFLNPDQGKIHFFDTEISRLPNYKIARLGLYRTFQMSLNPQRMTVMENMLLCPQEQAGEGILNTLLKPGRVKAQEDTHLQRAWQNLKLVNLQDLADTLAGARSRLQAGGRLILRATVLEEAARSRRRRLERIFWRLKKIPVYERTEAQIREFEQEFVEEVWNGDNYDFIEETHSEDYVGHWFDIEGDDVDQDGLEAFIREAHAGFFR